MSNSPKGDACCAIDSEQTTHCQSKQEHRYSAVTNPYVLAAISFIGLSMGLLIEHYIKATFFKGWVPLAWFILAYVPVAYPVVTAAWKSIKKGHLFTEFFLMGIATLGAFVIGEYPEAVAVMLFYAVGELFQGAAVQKARTNIKSLLDVRPKTATVFRDGSYINTNPEAVKIGETIQVKVGEKVPLDGRLISNTASLNTAALTGESKPQTIAQDEKIWAGSINLRGVIEVEVEKLFQDSSIARILILVQEATSRKSKTELLIRRLAKVYTPIVVYLAIAICVLPYFFVNEYIFNDWLYKALIFLVISCPCALVISIPLGYFGGLGAASKNGILFKGAKYLDLLTKVNTVVMDKTGTLTQGVFKIKDIVLSIPMAEAAFMQLVMALEAKSTHPIAKAILDHNLDAKLPEAYDIEEISGKGLKGKIENKTILAGNKSLLDQFNIDMPIQTEAIVESLVLVAIDQQFAGYITIADKLKPDAKASIDQLRKLGIRSFTILSGDKDSITQKVARELGVDHAKGGLLPEDKLNEIEDIKQEKSTVVAFIGDGINDAPVLAASDVGIAMGGLGSDVAIEAADIIIQTDQPSKLVTGIQIGRKTQQIIWQNIYLALGIKAMILIGGALGMATMWQAVFADVGVAFLAILNAIRLQSLHFK